MFYSQALLFNRHYVSSFLWSPVRQWSCKEDFLSIIVLQSVSFCSGSEELSAGTRWTLTYHPLRDGLL